MRANAFIPIKPIPESSSGYDNFLKHLQNIGATSNLADTIMYKHMADPKGSYNAQKTLRPTPLPELMIGSPEKTALLKAEPYLNKSTFISSPSVRSGEGFTLPEGNPYTDPNPRVAVSVGTNLTPKQVTSSVPHEVFGHAPTVARMEYQHPRQYFFDRKNGVLMNPQENASAGIDNYIRSNQEILAESNQAVDKKFSTRLSPKSELYDKYPQHRTAVQPNEQVINFFPKYMQDKGLVNRIANIGKRFGKIAGVVGSPLQALDSARLYDEVKATTNPTKAYQRWLFGNHEEQYN